MASIKCSNCGNAISKQAATCPKCGHPNKQANYLSGFQVLFYLALGGVVIWWLANRQMEGKPTNPIQMIESHVADDAVKQYEIAQRQGDKMQICVQAGLVSAAYLQAKDEANYTKWKATEAAACERAGLRQ